MSSNTEHKSVREQLQGEPWFKNVPDYMGEVVVLITEAKLLGTELMKRLDERESSLNDRVEVQGEKEIAFVSAVTDMRGYVEKIYGPDSVLSRIEGKIAGLEMASTNRETAIVRRMEQFETNQQGLKTWVQDQVASVNSRLDEYGRRLTDLERKSA